MAITRIKNNQITDSTITAQKIAAGTLVGSLFASNLTLNSNITVTGNLTIQGTTSTVSSTNTYINDPLLVFNNGYQGSPSYDIGMLVNRNLNPINAAWIWKEDDDAFAGVMTTETGTTTGSINVTSYANLKIGALTASSAAISGTVSTGLLSATALNNTPVGNTTPSTGAFTTLTSSGATTFTSATASTTAGTGAVVVTGGMGVGGNVYAGALYDNNNRALTVVSNLARNGSTGNANITGAYDSLTITLDTVNANVGTFGNITSFPVVTVDDKGRVTAMSTVDLSGVGVTALYGTANQVIVTGGATGNLTLSTPQNIDTNANVTFYSVTTTGNVNAGKLVTADAQITGGNISNTPISGNTGSFTTMTTANAQITGGAISSTPISGSTGAFTTLTANDAVTFTSTTESTAANVGAVVVSGGVGIAKSLNVGGDAAIAGNLSVNGTLTYVNTTSLEVSDKNVLVAKGAANATATYGAGITVDVTGAAITYESDNKWHLNRDVVANVFVGELTGNVTSTGSSSFANIDVNGGTIDGTAIGATTASTGAFTSLTATSVSTANAQITGGAISSTPISGSTGSFTSMTTANAQVTGGAISNTPISGNTGSFTTMTTADAQITGGNISNTPISGNTGSFTTMTTANAQVTGGAISSTPISGSTGSFTTLTANDAVTFTSTTESTASNIGAVVVSGGVGIAKNLNVGGDTAIAGNLSVNGTLTYVNTTSLEVTDKNVLVAKGAANATATYGAGITVDVTGAAITYESNDKWHLNRDVVANVFIGDLTGNVTSTGLSTFANVDINSGSIDGTAIGAASASTGNFTTLNATSVITANAQLTGGNLSNVAITSSTGSFTTLSATDLSSGNAVITGGNISNTPISGSTGSFTTMTTANAQVTGGAISNTPISGNTGSFTTMTTADAQITGGNISNTPISGNTGSFTTMTTANAQVTGGNISNTPISGNTGSFTTMTTADAQITGGNISNTPISGNTGSFTTMTTANAQITGGAISNTPISGNTGSFTTLTASGATDITDTTQSTDTVTGALKVAGGVGIVKNLNVGGDVAVSGNLSVNGTLTYVNTTSLEVTDKNVLVAKGAANVSATHGAGITVDVANATITYDANDKWNFNKDVVAATFNGNLVGNVTGDVTGNVTSTGLSTFSNIDVNGGSIDGTRIGNASPNTGEFTTLYATSAQFGSLNNTPIGNATPSTGAFTSLTVTGNILPSVTETYNLGSSTYRFKDLFLSGNTIQLGNSSISSEGTAETSVVYIDRLNISNLMTTSNAQVTGGALSNVTITNSNATFNSVTTANAIITGGSINSTPIGATTASTGAFTTLTATSVSTANAQVTGGAISSTPISGSTGSFTTMTTANAQVTGGAISSTPISGSTGDFTTMTTANAQVTGGAISSTPISGSTGSFTTLAASGAVTMTANTASTSTTTGTMVVTGGVGVSGNVNVGAGMTVNASQTATNFVVKGSTAGSLIYAAATENQVLIGGTATSANLVAEATLQINSTDSMLLPKGSNAQRPASPVSGQMRYNSTVNLVEYWDGVKWNTGTEFTVITDEQFTGNGVATAFTLSKTATTNSIMVSINGVMQVPTLAYSVSGTTLTFVEAPADGEIVDVRIFVTTQQVTGLADGYTTLTVDAAGINLGGKLITNPSATAVNTSAVVVDSFSKTLYRSAKYLVQTTNTSSGEYECVEVMVVHNGTTAYKTEFSKLYTGAAELTTITVAINGSNVELSVAGVSANNQVKVHATYIKV